MSLTQKVFLYKTGALILALTTAPLFILSFYFYFKVDQEIIFYSSPAQRLSQIQKFVNGENYHFIGEIKEFELSEKELELFPKEVRSSIPIKNAFRLKLQSTQRELNHKNKKENKEVNKKNSGKPIIYKKKVISLSQKKLFITPYTKVVLENSSLSLKNNFELKYSSLDLSQIEAYATYDRGYFTDGAFQRMIIGEPEILKKYIQNLKVNLNQKKLWLLILTLFFFLISLSFTYYYFRSVKNDSGVST